MNSNISFNKKIELLEKQHEVLVSISLDEDADIYARIFQANTLLLLENFFGKNNNFANQLSEVEFTSRAYVKNGRGEMGLKFKPDRFLESGRKAETILKSAISNIKLQQELLEISETPTTIYNDKPTSKSMKKVFIVHGHDNDLKNDVALFIQRLGIEPIILHEQVSRSQTIIEKIESYSDVGFSIVLYTPCDVGGSVSSKETLPRARQNVVFEHGYFVAKLGRENVVALKKGQVEVPNDLSGMVYVSYEQNNWRRDIAHELKASGYNIDFEKV